MPSTDRLPTTSIYIDGDQKEDYKVTLNEHGEVAIWCENSQAVWTKLADLKALVDRLLEIK